MSKNSSFFAFVAGAAAGALLATFARTEEGRKAKEAVKSYVKQGLDNLCGEPVEEEPEDWNGPAGDAEAQPDNQ